MNRLGGADKLMHLRLRYSGRFPLSLSINLQGSLPADVISNQRLNKNAELLISAHIRS